MRRSQRGHEAGRQDKSEVDNSDEETGEENNDDDRGGEEDKGDDRVGEKRKVTRKEVKRTMVLSKLISLIYLRDYN